MSEPEQPSMYMMLGLRLTHDDKKDTVFIMGMNPDKEEAKYLARQRAQAAGLPGPDDWLVVGIHRGPKYLESQIKSWLVIHDIIGVDANSFVRLVISNLVDIMEKAAKEAGENG